MAVTFNEIPSNVRVPGAYAEIEASQAERGATPFPLRGLILAQQNPTGSFAGTLAVHTPTRITSAAEASEYAGAGSPASRMAAAWFAVNQRTELYLCLVAETGTDATKTVTFSGTSAGGTMAFYLGGDRYNVDATGATTTIAANLAAAITANPEAPMTATAASSTVTLTAKSGGVHGEEIDVRHSHLAGERLPNGLTVTITDGIAATGTPSLTAALASLGSTQFDVIAHNFGGEAAALTSLKTELDSRADAMTALPGLAISAASGTVSSLAALTSSINSEYLSLVGLEDFPGVAYERGAAIAAAVARYGSNDPARPFQTLTLPGYAPAEGDRFTDAERELLLHDGVATTKSEDGTPRIERVITTYLENAAGAPSSAYLDANTVLTLSYLRKSWVARVALRFPRHKLAADGGTPPAPGSALVTPKSYQGEAVAWYAELVEAGIVEDEAAFARDSSFEINSSDPNRLDVVLAPNLVNQNRVTATLVQFRL